MTKTRGLLLTILLGLLVVTSPAMAQPTPFYVSDSFTLNFQDYATTGAWHYPGAFNMEKAWGASQPVSVEWRAGEFGAVAFGSDALQGFNADVFLCLYDIGAAAPGQPAPPVLVNGQPVILRFLASDGSPMGDGILMNGVHRYGQYARAARGIKDPIRLGGVTTPATGGPFQVGALMRFFGGGGTMSYQYFLQGVADPGGVTPPPAVVQAGSILPITEAGGLGPGQTKYTWTWAGSTNEADLYTSMVLPRDATLRALRVEVNTPPGAGQSYTFTIRKNGVNTPLTVTIAGTATVGADMLHEVPCAAGDRISLQEIASAGAAQTGPIASVEAR